MKRLMMWSITIGALLAGAAAAQAQVARVTYYQPATVYYTPPAYTVASPVVVTPAPTVTYYRAPAVVYRPTTTAVTRYRPLLGRTVTRVNYGYAPVYYPY